MNFKPDLKKAFISVFGGIFLGFVLALLFTQKSRCYETGSGVECVDTTILPFLLLGSITLIALIYVLLSLREE